MKSWLRSAWIDIKGESTRRGHPAPYPQSLAERLIKLFSFAGDTILDPFVGPAPLILQQLRPAETASETRSSQPI